MKKARAKQSEVFATTISSKGQMVIPAGVRSRPGLRKGMRVSISLGEGDAGPIVLRPITPEFIRHLRGSYKSAGAALEFLEKERRRERERGR